MAGRCGCTRICNCCQQTSESVAVSGAGSAGQCFQLGIRYSNDDGNRARPGTDGAVYADGCLVDPGGTPIVPDADGCARIPAPIILDYNGQPITPGDEGDIQLPTSGTTPGFGDGLTTDVDGNLLLAVSGTWPVDDLAGVPVSGADTDGSVVYVGADGLVYGPPEHTSATAGLAVSLLDPAGLGVPIPTSYTSPASPATTLLNVSPARRMVVFRFISWVVYVSNPKDALAQVVLQERIDGGTWADVRTIQWPNSPLTGATLNSEMSISASRGSVVAAGGTITLEQRVVVSKTGGGASSPVIISCSAANRLIGVTQ